MAARVTSVNFESTRSMSFSMRGSMSEGRRSAIRCSFGEVRGKSRRRRFAAVRQDTSDLGGGPIHVVVHHDGVELCRPDLLLVGGPGEATLDGLGAVGASILE